MNEELKKRLDQMSKIDIREVDINTLVDINDVCIDTELSLEERLQSFIEQINNPYCFRCGDMAVKVTFAETDVTLQDRMESYIKYLDNE